MAVQTRPLSSIVILLCLHFTIILGFTHDAQMCGLTFIVLLDVTKNSNCFGIVGTDPIVYNDDSAIVHLMFLCCIFLVLFKFNDDVLKHKESQNSASYDGVYGSLVCVGFIIIFSLTCHIFVCIICRNDEVLRIMSYISLLYTRMDY